MHHPRLCNPTLPGSLGGCPPSSSTVTSSLDTFLSHHLAEGTTTGYKYAFDKFVVYCSNNNYSPTTCGPEAIAAYLTSELPAIVALHDGKDFLLTHHKC